MAPTFTTDRSRFRQVLAELAEKAKVKLPESAGRIDKAVALVLAGDVEGQHEDGSWRVGSCVDPLVTHRVQGTSCSCDDSQFGRAPAGYCKHALACMLTIRVQEVLASEAPAVPPLGDPRSPLPEAPASVNVRVLVQGHEVQFTLRGEHEGAVFTRLQALLARKDVQPLPKPAPRKPYAGQNGQQRIGRDYRFKGA
jgi:hypothetical protein